MLQAVVRQIAILALLNGIMDTGRLLGVGANGANPFEIYTVLGFSLLGAFAIARIFAAVGIWIESNWGTPVLFITTLAELSVFLFALAPLSIGVIGFGVRLAQLAGSILILGMTFHNWRRHIRD